jgi:hypothetical protein
MHCQFNKINKLQMPEIGDTLTLAELISRSLFDNAFVSVNVVDGLITAVYRLPSSIVQEYWQAVPETDRLVLKRLMPNLDAKIE